MVGCGRLLIASGDGDGGGGGGGSGGGIGVVVRVSLRLGGCTRAVGGPSVNQPLWSVSRA